MELKIKPLSPKIRDGHPLPRFATAGAACMDLCACVDEAVTLNAGERRLVPTGIAIALPSPEYVALVFARSGLGIKRGVCLSNGVGVIDSDYRGEIGVGLVKPGRSALHGAARGPDRPADGGAGGAAHGDGGVDDLDETAGAPAASAPQAGDVYGKDRAGLRVPPAAGAFASDGRV